MACNHINNIAYLLCVFLLGHVKGEYGDSCITREDSCNVVNGSCYTNNNISKCSCNLNYYTDNNMCNSVTELKPTGVVIEGTPTSSSVTIKWTVPTKDAIQSFNIKGNGPNIEKTQLNKNFRAVTIAGLTPNTQYTDIKVETVVKTDRNPSLIVTSDPPFINFITSKAGYRETCVTPGTDQCDDTNTECVDIGDGNGNKCYCKEGFYTNNNQCFNAAELKTIIAGIIPKTNTATVSWTLPSNSQFISSISIEVNGIINKSSISNTATSSEITGLQPGTMYSIKVISIVNTDRKQNYEVKSKNVSNTTNPGKPGPLNSDNNYDTTKVMNIGFVKPTGGVDKYIVQITGPGLNTTFTQEPTTNSITLPANTLQPGRQYNISIIAVYNGKNSAEFVGVFNTNSRGSDPVKDLNITNINSRSLTVSWSYPDEDMGVLTAYILDVKIGSECIQQYIYVTDINNKPTTNNCAGVTPTYSVTDLKAGIIQIIIDLLPYINYTLIVTPYNNVRPGSVASKSELTYIEAAGEPSNLNVIEINAKSFLVTWNKPSLKTGPTTYYLYLYERNNLANNQASQLVKTHVVQGFDTEEYRVNDVVSYWYYRVELQASTAAGNSSIKSIPEFQTLPSAPGKVKNLAIEKIKGQYSIAKVSWSCPNDRDRNGVIKNYTLTSTLEYATNMGFKGEEAAIEYTAPTESRVFVI
ncbi:hypothetical protein LOTGIDRAFT_169286 [Lottia gigantea]|uniref:Fibronectin type-III domain-containing protein n=1 Tax=Lottia gigantea TaxID=225164 RepID=V3ZGZ7_LOTGI|nr:hypothetical protein LOTGIDRAFT_169286 [Lottia gigantea]ESO83422.1 hypothetical protein LOTGIDRAFT_169286 [Lottia gigantea]